MLTLTTFLDGPAKGTPLTLERTPIFLRVTRNQKGEIDALDQLDDVATPEERLFVYHLVGGRGTCHVDAIDPRTKRRVGHWYHTASYALFPTQPAEETIRSFPDWSVWTREQWNQRPKENS